MQKVQILKLYIKHKIDLIRLILWKNQDKYYQTIQNYANPQLFLIPNSCGNSSHITASDTLIPVNVFSVNAAPIERPSTKLCIASPINSIHATVATPPGPRSTVSGSMCE